jgi:hypothetical protein
LQPELHPPARRPLPSVRPFSHSPHGKARSRANEKSARTSRSAAEDCGSQGQRIRFAQKQGVAKARGSQRDRQPLYETTDVAWEVILIKYHTGQSESPLRPQSADPSEMPTFVPRARVPET